MPLRGGLRIRGPHEKMPPLHGVGQLGREVLQPPPPGFEPIEDGAGDVAELVAPTGPIAVEAGVLLAEQLAAHVVGRPAAFQRGHVAGQVVCGRADEFHGNAGPMTAAEDSASSKPRVETRTCRSRRVAR